jgi:hypothetical protein
MSIKVFPETKIYVLTPANIATGGTELLHQLVFHLRKDLRIDAYLYYYPVKNSNPVPKEFQNYEAPYVREIEENNKNILIGFESFFALELLQKFKNIRKGIWWLSVDNFFLSLLLSSKRKFYKQLLEKNKVDIREPNYISKLLKIKAFNPLSFEVVKEADFHLAQSYYALNFLKEKLKIKSEVYYLSDYLNEEFLKTNVDIRAKQDIVAYNPKKGLSFTRKIISKAPNIKFIPIHNMSRKEVIETLKKAKVYIDFGNHPGKDRLPREAAILGCCVITGKRGSAKYFQDVPIPDEFKIEDREENIPLILKKIEECFTNFYENYKKFEEYRKWIKLEPEKFVKDLKTIFTFSDN